MRAREIFEAPEQLRLSLERTSEKAWLIVAKIGDELVGTLSIGPSRSGYGLPGSYSVMNVGVNPQHQRKGIATAMYDFAYKKGFAPLTPDPKQSPDGQAFWAKAYGKKLKLGQPRPTHEWGKLRDLRKPKHGPPA